MENKKFILHSPYEPKGDQPTAINSLVENLNLGIKDQILLGVTGSGKTFSVAKTIERVQRPALILAPNKTLAAQLYNEFKSLFPENAVEYFVSYYDYYQPEAYVPTSDTYIEKDSSINDNIDKLRHAATHSLLTRRDVIIIASVSCIYGLGSPEYYARLVIPIEEGQKLELDALITRLVEVQYERNDYDFHRGTFRVRGDALEIIPAYHHERALRIEFFGNEIESIREIDPLTGEVLNKTTKTVIFPASHYVSDRDNLTRAMSDIRTELQVRLSELQSDNKLVEAQRLEQRTQLDLEMLQELGYCNGIENYSRHLDGREQGSPPSCLLDYFPKDFILFADESHITIPQVGAMYKGDMSRKSTLVSYGFRLPSALDNRPLDFTEFLERIDQSVYVSATPGRWETEKAQGLVIEQIIRPTGIIDPDIEIRSTKGQIEDLLTECKKRATLNQRVLVTTLTKRMAEELTDFCNQHEVKTKYLHSDIDTLERMAIIQALRQKEFDVLVGINLLREGLDIPEVSLVAILDADKEGFLRSTGSLIQTIGRAARNSGGRVIMYADNITKSMRAALDESERRRTKQIAYNLEHNITPKSVVKEIDTAFSSLFIPTQQSTKYYPLAEPENPAAYDHKSIEDLGKEIQRLERAMRESAKNLEFEQAAKIRDRITMLRQLQLASDK